MVSQLAYIDREITIAVQGIAVYPDISGIRLGKRIDFYLIDRAVRRAFILRDLRCKARVIHRNTVGDFPHWRKLIHLINDQVLKPSSIRIRLHADRRYKCKYGRT